MNKTKGKTLRRFSQIAPSVGTHAKVDSPLAKYDSAGNLMCIICKTVVKSANVWIVHINSKQHKLKLDAARQINLKTQLSLKRKPNCSSSNDYDSREQCSLLSSNSQLNGSKNQLPPAVNITAKEKKETINTNENTLPEKFFDDPAKDAKVRNVEHKDQQNIEWERFLREIKEETVTSNIIIIGEQNEAAVDREIKEIDEQIGCWTKFVNLQNKGKVLRKYKHEGVGEVSASSDESDDCDWNDVFSDWRSKKFDTIK